MGNLLLSNYNSLVFDFDGTMCRLFSNYDLHATVLQLCSAMKKYNIDFSQERDSFDVFSAITNDHSLSADAKKAALTEANDIITSAEIDAVDSGEVVNYHIIEHRGVFSRNAFIRMECPKKQAVIHSEASHDWVSCVIPDGHSCFSTP